MKVGVQKLLCVVAIAGLGQGCTGSKALRDPELRRRAANVAIVEPKDLQGRPYTVLGEVSAATCTSGMYRTNYSPAALQEMLKGEAASLHADAVTQITCGEGGVRMECWTSYECRGDAIRWEPETAGTQPAPAEASSTEESTAPRDGT
ncbi:Rcs stress response system protein RcsF [Hyalangium rubrum]|uniref:Rcs stress response system protein RcsF n=1 Tax=Hyalangium rubrum TaxID=3103134 RepID=A0ABU5H224_9BACT|nr:Rcs stress response system protein RcsF [Hyalangium sp. s54d21]MDY7227169.1 Rcs stress response system protein RcsF [Hyalangium sp. s54d21]